MGEAWAVACGHAGPARGGGRAVRAGAKGAIKEFTASVRAGSTSDRRVHSMERTPPCNLEHGTKCHVQS